MADPGTALREAAAQQGVPLDALTAVHGFEVRLAMLRIFCTTKTRHASAWARRKASWGERGKVDN